MSFWNILGIEPTNDKSAIQKAYAALSVQYHPEEYPEEFQEIHAAYCFALKYVRYQKKINDTKDVEIDFGTQNGVTQCQAKPKPKTVEVNFYTEAFEKIGKMAKDFEKITEQERHDFFMQAIEQFDEMYKDFEQYTEQEQTQKWHGFFKQAFEKSGKTYRDFAYVYYHRANVHTNKGEYYEAVEEYAKAIEIDPYNANIYCSRGSVYYDIGEYDFAIEDYTAAIEIEPYDATIYYNRGGAHIGKGEYYLAVDEYTKAIEIDPNFTSAYIKRAFFSRCNHAFNNAIKDYTKLIELDPHDAGLYYDRGVAYKRNGDYYKASKDFSKAILMGIGILAEILLDFIKMGIKWLMTKLKPKKL